MSSHEVNESTPSLVGTSVRGVDDTEEHFTDISEAKKQSLVTAPSGRKQSDQSDKDYSTLVDLADEGALMCEEEKYAALLDESGKLKPNAYVNLDTEAIKQQDNGEASAKAVAEDDLVEDEGSDKAGDAVEPPAGQFKTPSSSSLEKTFDIITKDDVAANSGDGDNKASSIYSLKNEGQSNMSLDELIDSQMASFTELSSTLQTKISKKSSPSRKSKSKSKKKKNRRDSTSGLIPESVIENDSLQTVPAGAAEGARSPFVHPRSTSALRSSAGGANTNSTQSTYFDNSERPHLARGESYNGSASELRPGRTRTRDDPLKSLRSESREYLSSISRSRTRAPEPIVSNSELIEEGALINDSQYDQQLDEARDNVIDHADEIVSAEPVTGPVTEMGRIEEESKPEDASLAKAGKPIKGDTDQVSKPAEVTGGAEEEEADGAKSVEAEAENTTPAADEETKAEEAEEEKVEEAEEMKAAEQSKESEQVEETKPSDEPLYEPAGASEEAEGTKPVEEPEVQEPAEEPEVEEPEVQEPAEEPEVKEPEVQEPADEPEVEEPAGSEDVEPVEPQTEETETKKVEETAEPREPQAAEPEETKPEETEPAEVKTSEAELPDDQPEVKPLEKSLKDSSEKETIVDSVSKDLEDLRLASAGSPSKSKTTISEAERLIKELEDAMDDHGDESDGAEAEAEAEAEAGDEVEDKCGTEPEEKAEAESKQAETEPDEKAEAESKQAETEPAETEPAEAQAAKQVEPAKETEAEAQELHEPSREEIIELLKDEPVYIYTSLAGGGFMMPSRTNMLETILRANRVPFTFRDLGTDEQARSVWKRYGRGRQLPGVVRGKDDIIGNWEEIQEANESYQVRHLIYETL